MSTARVELPMQTPSEGQKPRQVKISLRISVHLRLYQRFSVDMRLSYTYCLWFLGIVSAIACLRMYTAPSHLRKRLMDVGRCCLDR
jgi:hypothetical protein